MSMPAVHGMTLTGTAMLTRFALRRDRATLPWWLLGISLLLAVQSLQSQRLYDTPADLAQLRRTMGGNAAVVALSGPIELLDSIGGEVVFEIFAYLAVVIALMNMFTVARHTRADEETGRLELIRSARVGRHATIAAALCVAFLADLAAAVLVWAVAVGTGLPAGGSALLGLAVAGVGLSFAAVTAVATQVFENTRSAHAAVALLLGGAYVLRAAGDVGNDLLAWLSPIGWGQRVLPYTANRAWPLLLLLGASVLLLALAMMLLDRRDFSSGLVPPRPGRPEASRLLGSPLGLAWRLQRGSVAGWICGITALSAAYGSLGDTIERYAADNPDIADVLPDGGKDVLDSYLGLTMLLSALLAAAFGAASVLRARKEEDAGRAEPILATATSRQAWFGGHLLTALAGSALAVLAAGLAEGLTCALAMSDAGQFTRLAAQSLTYVPAVWLVIGAAAAGVAWLPRAAAALTWVLISFCAVVALFASALNLPAWVEGVSPFTHTPRVPLDDITATPLIALTVGAVLALVGALAGIARRDLAV